MKLSLLLMSGLLIANVANAQVSITASDMPVKGDTLRYSTAAPVGSGINLNDTGANKTWNYSNLQYLIQRVDEYKSAIQVNPTYGLTISLSAYGYKVADTFTPSGLSLPITITDAYNFFNKMSGPSRFITEAFAANVNGLPIPANYQDEDEVYFFPLAYGNPEDSSDYLLDVNIPSLGSLTQDGYRKTKVDGWGTIVTPYFTTPQSCIRVRSEVYSMDSFQVSPLPAIGIVRHTVDYKWLIPGEHYPALWVTTNIVAGNEAITNVRYRDQYRPPLTVENTIEENTLFKMYPNPASDVLNITSPDNTQPFLVEIFDVQGRLMLHANAQSRIDISGLSKGNYIIRCTHNTGHTYDVFVKQ